MLQAAGWFGSGTLVTLTAAIFVRISDSGGGRLELGLWIVTAALCFGAMVLLALWFATSLRTAKPDLRRDQGTAITGDVSASVVAPHNRGAVHVVMAPQTPVKPDWWRRSGAPRITFHAAFTRDLPNGFVHYDMSATVSPFPQDLRYRWRGLGIQTDWKHAEAGPRDTIHLKSVDVNLESEQPDSDLADQEIGVEFQFWFDSEECHYMQVWPAANGLVGPDDERYDVRRW